jgi:hypothetical protein
MIPSTLVQPISRPAARNAISFSTKDSHHVEILNRFPQSQSDDRDSGEFVLTCLFTENLIRMLLTGVTHVLDKRWSKDLQRHAHVPTDTPNRVAFSISPLRLAPRCLVVSHTACGCVDRGGVKFMLTCPSLLKPGGGAHFLDFYQPGNNVVLD